MRFKDRVIIVTGAGGGIGESVAKQMAIEGAIVAVVDRNIEAAKACAADVTKKGGKASAYRIDVSSATDVQDCFRLIEETLGPLSALVNCAGIREIVPVLDLSLEEWNQVFAVNVTGTFLCSQIFAKSVLSKGGAGAIVNVASAITVLAAPKRAAYTASKHAVVGLTKQMAYELGQRGIRINAVGPGVIKTPLTETYTGEAADAGALNRMLSPARVGLPEEIAKAILFLASDDASYCNGTYLIIDGAWSVGKTLT